MDNGTITKSPVETARHSAGISLSALATLTGIPRTTLRRKVANPRTFTVSELHAVAAVLEVDADDMFLSIVEVAA